MSSNLDPAKLKVADLRNELSARGLDVKGTKPVLVKRLKDALEKELEEEIPDTSIVDTSTEEAEEPPAPRKSLRGSTDEKEEVRPSRSAPAVTPPSPEKPKSIVKTPEKTGQEKNVKPAACVKVPEQPKTVVKTPEQPKPVVKTPEQPKPVVKTPEQSKPVVKTPEQSKPVVKTPEKPKVEVKSPVKPQTQAKSPEKPKAPEAKEKVEVESADKKAKLEQENGEQETKMDVQEVSEQPAGEESKPEEGDEQKGEKRKRSSDSPERVHKRAKSPVKEDEPEINAEAVQLSWYDSDLHLQVDKTTFLSAKPLTDGVFGYVWAGARATHGVSTGKVCYEVKVAEKIKWEEYPPRPDRDRDNRDSRDSRYKTDHRRDRRDDKRNQKSSESAKSDSEKPKDSSETNEESEKKDENAENKDVTKAPEDVDNKSESADKAEETAAKADEPMDTAEVDEKKVEENGEKKDDDKDKMEDDKDKKDDDDKDKKDDDKDKKEDDKDKDDDKDKGDKDKKEKVEEPPLPTHFIRIGWSIASASLQLGEDKHSYSYESSGKAVKEKEFSDYGVTFDAGDVVGAFLDISDTTVTLQFTVNGQVQPSMQIAKSDLPEDFVLYPHVLTRNYSFELNFGEQEEPLFAIPSELAGYQFISKSENKVVGPARPESRADCEVLMMCGLPASGKTHWVKEHVGSNLDKHYTVLGTTGLFERMTICGEPLKPKYKGRWSSLIDRLSKSLNRLVSMAALRRRNYIIDQTNVFPSAQRRKMRPFEGFKRKAVIVVNGEEEQARRQALQEAVEGKEVPDSTLLEMKAAMVLPEVGDWLEEIVYVGATEEEAKEIIKTYNAAGKAAGYGSERRFNKDRWNYNRRNDYRGGRNFQRQGGGYNRQPYPQSRWGAAPRQGGGGSSGGGGWKQDSRSRDWRSSGSGGGGSYERRDRDYYNQGSYGGRSQQQPRSQGSGQRWGGSGGWSGQGGGGGWNQQSFGGGGGGGRNYGQGWGGQSGGGQGGWGGKYGSSGSGGGGQNQGYGYNNWNYYGQQQQNWSGQK